MRLEARVHDVFSQSLLEDSRLELLPNFQERSWKMLTKETWHLFRLQQSKKLGVLLGVKVWWVQPFPRKLLVNDWPILVLAVFRVLEICSIATTRTVSATFALLSDFLLIVIDDIFWQFSESTTFTIRIGLQPIQFLHLRHSTVRSYHNEDRVSSIYAGRVDTVLSESDQLLFSFRSDRSNRIKIFWTSNYWSDKGISNPI